MWEANLQALWRMLYHLVVTGAKQQAKNAQSWPPVFSALTPPNVKRALVRLNEGWRVQI
jgi:hypothetical protein